MFKSIADNPLDLGITLAILGLVGGGFFSWLFTFFYFKKGQVQKLLCYTVRDSDYLGYRRAGFHNLSVHYGDRKLSNPVRFTIYAWNCGNVTIDGSDISKIDPLAFGTGDIEILEVTPIWSTRDSINASQIASSDKTKVFVEFDFLDPDDGIGIQLLADRTNRKGSWSNRLEARGAIKGLKRSPFYVTAGFSAKSWWGVYIGIAAAIFFAFSAVAIFYDAWQAGMAVTSFVKGLAAAIFMLLAFAIGAISLEGYGDRSFVIPALLRNPETQADDEDQLPLLQMMTDHVEQV